MTKKKPAVVSDIYAHGATKPLLRAGNWIYFGATVSDAPEYPVMFQIDDLPKLIKWLQEQSRQDQSEK